MLLRVDHRCVFGVVLGVELVPVSHVRVVGGFDVIAALEVLRRLAMVFRGQVVMVGSVAMELRSCMRGHGASG